MNPRSRDADEDRLSWGRWDLPGARTIYTAASPLGAFMETLAWESPAQLPLVGDLFDDENNPNEPLESEIEREWAAASHMKPGALARGWRDDRCLYQLKLPDDGWLVDISTSDSVSALNRVPELTGLTGDDRLDTQGSSLITSGDLQGRNRDLTTQAAEWIYKQTLFDGHLPHGIVYPSKWGSDLMCGAIWLRKIADGHDEAVEPTKRLGHGQPIELHDHCFLEACAKLGIKAF